MNIRLSSSKCLEIGCSHKYNWRLPHRVKTIPTLNLQSTPGPGFACSNIHLFRKKKKSLHFQKNNIRLQGKIILHQNSHKEKFMAEFLWRRVTSTVTAHSQNSALHSYKTGLGKWHICIKSCRTCHKKLRNVGT